jgi:hypothetical protein
MQISVLYIGDNYHTAEKSAGIIFGKIASSRGPYK